MQREAREVGLQGRQSCARNSRVEVDGGCLECRQIAQRGPGKKALQPGLLPSFKQHSRAALQSRVGCGGSSQLALLVTPSPEGIAASGGRSSEWPRVS